jgi:hypothetical protein
MAMTGAAFAATTAFWPLLLIAFVGTMNPTSGDASIFLPLEQAALAQTAEPRRRTAVFARYSVIGSLAGALGTLAAAAPDWAADWGGVTRLGAMQAMFAAYAGLGLVTLVLYRPLTPAIEAKQATRAKPLQQSKRLVYGLAALFGMDSFGTGFLVPPKMCTPVPLPTVAAGVVALPAVSDLGHGRGDDPVLERDLLGRLLPHRGADRRAHRADQHDGVYPSAVEHPAGPRPLRA